MKNKISVWYSKHVDDAPISHLCFNFLRRASCTHTWKTGMWLFIHTFDDPETQKYQQLIVDIINRVTPCELISYNDRKIIKYQLTNHYNKDLILLSFIRNLWHDPAVGSIQYSKRFEKEGYPIAFFQYLEQETNNPDPMVALTTANMKALKDVGCTGNVGHSNCVSLPAVRTLEDFTSLEGHEDYSYGLTQTTEDFLMNKK